MHSSRMHTIHSSSHLSRGGGLPQCMLGYQPPPRTRHPPGADPLDQAHTPRPGTHPPCGQPHACENITFAASLWTVKVSTILHLDVPPTDNTNTATWTPLVIYLKYEILIVRFISDTACHLSLGWK